MIAIDEHRATLLPVDQIGIRQLRLRTAEVLRRVKAGESLEVTEFGRPIARIIPLGLSRWEQLKAAGEIEPAQEAGDPLDFEPIEIEPGKPTLSEILQQMRDEDPR